MQVQAVVQNALQPPNVQTRTYPIKNEFIEMPRITVCNVNRVNASKVLLRFQ